MKFKIHYDSFSLSKGTEAIRWTERAEWFFRDHKLDYTIVFIDFYKESGVKCIQWSEELDVNIPINTLPELKNYTEVYHCKITVEKDLYTIKFNEV